MALFSKSSPEKKFQADIDAARSARDKIASRLADAEAMVIQRRASAQKLAVHGDDDALSGAEAAKRAAEDRVETLNTALNETDQRLAELERKRDELAEAKKRRETCAEIQRVVEKLENAGQTFDAAVVALGDAAKSAALVVNDGTGLRIFADQLHEAAPPAIELIVSLMRAHSNSVLNGIAPTTLRAPEALAAPPLPAPATTAVYLIKPVRWQDQQHAHFTQHRPAFSQADLPVALAEKAIAVGAAIDITDPRARTLSRGNAPVHAPLEKCVCLDDNPVDPAAEPEPQHEEPIKHSAFNKGPDFLGA
jgi:hypothetical protein